MAPPIPSTLHDQSCGSIWCSLNHQRLATRTVSPPGAGAIPEFDDWSAETQSNRRDLTCIPPYMGCVLPSCGFPVRGLPVSTSWWFKEDVGSDRPQWVWRTTAADGSTINRSGTFDTYGKAIIDALQHGFRPTEDSWAIETDQSIAKFGNGQQKVFTPKINGKPINKKRSTPRER
jgi:hypothetical protein